MADSEDALYDRIYAAVRLTPLGSVSTYGDIASIVGAGCDARTVGYALNAIPKRGEAGVPWQRIVNREGGISTPGPRQEELLRAEGVPFDVRTGRVDMSGARWSGPNEEQRATCGLHALPPRDEPTPPTNQLSLFPE